MISITIPLPDNVARDILIAATRAGIPADEYMTSIFEAEIQRQIDDETASNLDVEQVVADLFAAANKRPIGTTFTVNNLYETTHGIVWDALQPGFRKSLGKRFRKLVDESPRVKFDGGWRHVKYFQKTVQNMIIYRVYGPGADPGWPDIPESTEASS